MEGKRKYKRPESWGSLRKLPSGRHQASYLHNGERYNAPHTFDGIQDARAWLAGVRADIQRGKWKSPKEVRSDTFMGYASNWVAERTSPRGVPLRPKTRAEYERQIEKGLVCFADDKLQAITAARVRTWHSDRMKAGKTAAAAEARLLRAILATAVEDGVLESNPVPSKLTKSSAGNTYRPPTLGELAVLRDQMDVRYRLAILLAAYGGLRLSEWRGLRRRDLTLTDGRYVVAVVRQAQYVRGQGWIIGAPKSQRGLRVQHLPKWMTELVDQHLTALVGPFPESLLFASKGGSTFIHDSDFNKCWNVARDQAGVRGTVREHDLRGFSGSHIMASAGASLIEARDFLGHSNSAVTEKHYIHKVSDRAAELADAMPQLPGILTAPSALEKATTTG